jgi:hypothetical protein
VHEIFVFVGHENFLARTYSSRMAPPLSRQSCAQ